VHDACRPVASEGVALMSEPPVELESWERRLGDPAEPLFTMAVVADLLGLDQQALRRLEVGLLEAARSSGNHRRYSRDDIALLAYAARLADEGLTKPAISRVISLEQQVAHLAAAAGHTVDIVEREAR
jgi:MerR family transcriptional regulator, heat shock protein HspR